MQPPVGVTLDGIEMWVGDLAATRRLLTTAYGFQQVEDEGGVENDGGHDRTVRLVCGGVRLVLRQGSAAGTGSVTGSMVGRHVAVHGDTVTDVVLTGPEPGLLADRAIAHGLTVTGPPDAPAIDLFGDHTVCHTIRSAGTRVNGPPAGGIDHVAYCLPRGLADVAANTYQQVFGMRRLDADSFESVASGMRSVVLRSPGGFTVVLTEPTGDGGDGQTQRFVDAHAGPGVQHAALSCVDLAATVATLRAAGAAFLPIPAAYYERARRRLDGLGLDWEMLRQREILIDADPDGLLYQVFTRPITDRGTFFFELIQRAGATGFGANNVRALYEALQASLAGRTATAGER